MLIQIKLSGLKRAYKKAVAEKKETFRYNACNFSLGLTKSLIAYFQGEYRRLNLSEDEAISFNNAEQLKNGYSMLYHGSEVDEEDARCGITDKELRND